MTSRVNITYPTALVLSAMRAGSTYGFDIMDATGLPSGTVYPLLRRLEAAGCVAAEWEDEQAAQQEARPARRYYTVTDAGLELLDRARQRFAGVEHHLHARETPA